jgi:hypothetical protein
MPRATDFDKFNLALIARLEANRGPGSDIQPQAVGALAVERQPPVHLEEVAMRPDLYRPIAAILHCQRQGPPAGVEFNFAVCEEIFTGNHRFRSYPIG